MDIHYTMFIIALCALQTTHTFISVQAFHGPSSHIQFGLARASTDNNSRLERQLTALDAFNLKKKRTASPQQPAAKSVPRIAVKPRPLVSLDEKTGRYIPPKQVSVSSSSSQDEVILSSVKEQPDDYYENMSGWSTFKDGIYGVVDVV
eukprot:207336_1